MLLQYTLKASARGTVCLWLHRRDIDKARLVSSRNPMQLSETVKLCLTKEQLKLVAMTMDTYISTVNRLVCDAVSGISIAKYTSADVKAKMPSALKNQCIRDAKSIVNKHYKSCRKAVVQNRKNAKRKSCVRTTAAKLPV